MQVLENTYILVLFYFFVTYFHFSLDQKKSQEKCEENGSLQTPFPSSFRYIPPPLPSPLFSNLSLPPFLSPQPNQFLVSLSPTTNKQTGSFGGVKEINFDHFSCCAAGEVRGVLPFDRRAFV